MSEKTENVKQENLLRLIQKKKECDKRALEIVLQLIEPEVQQDYLLQKAIHLGPNHFQDVVEERSLTGICGWTLCKNPLDPNIQKKTQKYAIRGKRVLDITERKAFCSSKCFAKSTHFKKQLMLTPLWMREEEEETTTFEILDDDTELHGLNVDITGLKLDDDKDKEEDSASDLEVSSKNVGDSVT